jgi:hypothetical protein
MSPLASSRPDVGDPAGALERAIETASLGELPRGRASWPGFRPVAFPMKAEEQGSTVYDGAPKGDRT